MEHITAIQQKESAHTLTSELQEKVQQQNSELKEKNSLIIKLDEQLHQLLQVRILIIRGIILYQIFRRNNIIMVA
jgi:cytochrome b